MSLKQEFYCPITGAIMVNPVTTAAGHTYERSAIEKWFEECRSRSKPFTDPKTGSNLISNRLFTNYALKTLINEYLDLVKKTDDDCERNDNQVHIKNKDPNKDPIKNQNLIIAVVDISGSMDSSSVETSDNSFKEGADFSRLDLVKHSLKTMYEMLNDDDHLAIVTFSDESYVPIEVDEIVNKHYVFNIIDSMSSGGSTNLKDGILKGLELANKNVKNFKKINIIVLTDGEPTNGFDRDSLRDISNAMDNNIFISTIAYGFGSALDSSLLMKISEIGNGTYAYICDGSMVGAIFINLMSNILSENHTIHLTSDEEIIRYEFCKTLENAITEASLLKFADAIELMMNFRKKLSETAIVSDYSNHIKNDIFDTDYSKGQIVKGFQSWEKWGHHYLPSILIAHKRFECMNFKDESMQDYLNDDIRKIIKKGSEKFVKIPQNKPSRSQIYERSLGLAYQPSQTSSLLHSRICFSGDTFITMFDEKSFKMASDIRKNDKLKGGAIVECVVIHKGSHKFLDVGSAAKATYWHPIFVDDKWTFPVHKFTKETSGENSYNFVLNKESNRQVYIGLEQIPAVTFGHNLKDDEPRDPNCSLEHDFFSTEKVIENLSGMNGYYHGLVFVKDSKRNSSGKVCELI
jgi:Mg-chelatase subunit ChlD